MVGLVVIKKLIFIFVCVVGIWFVACLLSWVVGGYLYAFFYDWSYSLEWWQVVCSAKIAILISSVVTLFVWFKFVRENSG